MIVFAFRRIDRKVKGILYATDYEPRTNPGLQTSTTGRCGLLIMRMWPTVPICSGGKLSRNYVRRCEIARAFSRTKCEIQIDLGSCVCNET